MFSFSVHPDTVHIGNQNYYAKGYLVKPVRLMQEMGQLVLRHHSSPVIWIGGKRTKDNFLFADFAVIDVDHGMSLDEAHLEFKEYRHVIGTTKRHGLDGDRFRVFIPFERRIDKCDQYTYTNKLLAARYCADPAAANAAQAFLPLKAIVSISETGKTIPVSIPVDRPYVPRPVATTTPGASRQIPSYIQRWLAFGAPKDEANLTCFKAACGLKKVGFSKDEILNTLLSSAIPVNQSPAVRSEVLDAVNSAWKRI